MKRRPEHDNPTRPDTQEFPDDSEWRDYDAEEEEPLSGIEIEVDPDDSDADDGGARQ